MPQVARGSTAASSNYRVEVIARRPTCTYNSLRRPSARAAQKESQMAWTKPEFTVVAVTLEVTAYAGKK